MTTKITGGKITGLLALSCEAQYAAEIGDVVHLTGPYEVALADATKEVLGIVSVSNKKRVGSDYPVAISPGPVTVEARGLMVITATSGGAIAAGAPVKPDASAAGKKFVTAVVGDLGRCGIALTTTAGANLPVDILVR